MVERTREVGLLRAIGLETPEQLFDSVQGGIQSISIDVSATQAFFLEMVATFILVFISSWNEFLLALILTGSRSQTLPIAVASQIAQFDVRWGNMMAAGVITTVPVLVLALLSQRYLTRGLALGGVTG